VRDGKHRTGQKEKEIAMRADRPLIGAVLFLGAGLGLIIGYCHGTTGFNAAYPFTGSILHIDMTTTGPGVLGGLLLAMVGALFLVWAFLAALVRNRGASGVNGWWSGIPLCRLKKRRCTRIRRRARRSSTSGRGRRRGATFSAISGVSRGLPCG
jgi:hypothetical protein